MATPFKRVCLHAANVARQHSPRPFARQWHLTPSQPLSTTSSKHAESIENTISLSRLSPNNEVDLPNNLNSTNESALAQRPSDAELDRLAKKPGVIYTISEEASDLSNQNLDLSSLGQRELAQHRELREATRLAAWTMPQLAAFAKPFNRPSRAQILKWRFTTYMGESHPAEAKVVLEFAPHRIQGLRSWQIRKLIKLVGARYSPSKRLVKMSSDSFETQAQNKRFLAETFERLVAEVRDEKADRFEDVPVDRRHFKARTMVTFPVEWRMTEERRMSLDEKRQLALAEETKRVEEGRVLGGAAIAEEARRVAGDGAAEKEAVHVGARSLSSQR